MRITDGVSSFVEVTPTAKPHSHVCQFGFRVTHARLPDQFIKDLISFFTGNPLATNAMICVQLVMD